MGIGRNRLRGFVIPMVVTCFSVFAVHDYSFAQVVVKQTKLKKTTVKKKTKKKRKLLSVAFSSLSANREKQKSQINAKASPDNNRERFVLLTPGGPIVVESRLNVEKKPFRTLREKSVDQLLALADTNGDGKATWKEAMENPRFKAKLGTRGRSVQFAIAPDGKQLRLQFATNKIGKMSNKPRLDEQFDTNNNGIVDRHEARFALSTGSAGPAFNLTAARNSELVPKIFKILDTDKNGSLSEKEMELASKQLKSRDADDNDLLDITELGGGNPNQNEFVIVSGGGFGRGNRSTTAYLLGRAADLDALFNSMTKEYGGKSGKIGKDAFTLVPKLFTALDRNSNGQIDKTEIEGFRLQHISPHLVFEANLSSKDKKDLSTIKFLAGESRLKKVKIQSVGKNEILVDLKVVKLRFSVSSAGSTQPTDRIAKMMMQSYDKNNNGYIEKKEIPKGNADAMNQFLNWDADSNGKVYPKEVEKGFQEQFATNSSRISATVSKSDPSLFSVLDASGDGVVGLREIRNASVQLQKIDSDKDGKFSASELSGEISVKFSRGQQGPMLIGNSIFAVGGYGSRSKPRIARKVGPKWFQEMDRNSDGDISLKEFLGEKEQFKAIDTNKDGFIEAKEATEFNKQHKK